MKLMSFTKKKVVALALAGGLAAGMGGIAAAFFSAGGTGTGYATVTHPASFTVSQTHTSASALTPDSYQFVTLKLHNNSTGHETYSITHTDITIATTAGNIVTATSGTAVTGCKSTWFTINTTPIAAAGQLAGDGTTAFTVLVGMTNGTGTAGSTQNACQNSVPKILVNFSA